MESVETLKAEILRLETELEKERKKNRELEYTIAQMKEQELNMAAMFRGTRPGR